MSLPPGFRIHTGKRRREMSAEHKAALAKKRRPSKAEAEFNRRLWEPLEKKEPAAGGCGGLKDA